MTNTPNEPVKASSQSASRDAANWAKPVARLSVSPRPGADPVNVTGRQMVGPQQGFGQLWQKTYRVRLSGTTITPTELVSLWKKHFPEFWPKGNTFYGPITGIAPGEIGVINVSIAGPLKLSTGVMVIYADDESFTFMTPEGHMLAGWITFSAAEEDGATVVQVQALIRPNDPIYEMGFRLGIGHKKEDAFWRQTLHNVAMRVGVANPSVGQQVTCVDSRMQWSKFGNIRYNAGIGTVLYQVAAPARWVKRLFSRQ